MLEGEISEIQLIERLVELWREQFTGAIRFENDGIIKIVYFKSGDVLSASTNDRADSVDEILMRAGKVSREHVKQALAKRKESETLGDALLNLGFITRKELTWARRVQVVGVIRSIAAWTHGSFTIVADYLPKRDEGTLFPLPQLLVELIVTEQDRPRFERAMNGGEAVFAKAADFYDVFRRLGLNDDAEAIAAEIDGEKTAAQVAVASGRDTFNVYKLLEALATLGILTRSTIPQASPQVSPQLSMDDFATAGVADAADMWSEPPQPSEPQFELDDTEAMAMPEPAPSVPAYDERPNASAWDEDEEPATTAKMPAWDTPPREQMSVPMPAQIEPPADADEEQWGFDEAQLETARRAAVRQVDPPADDLDLVDPAAARPPREGRRYGFIVALLLLVILAGAGYGAFLWWKARDAASVEPLAVARSQRVLHPAQTTTTTATEASLATSTAPTTTSPATSSANAPMTITATPATASTTTFAPRTATLTPRTSTTTTPPLSAAATTAAPTSIARTPITRTPITRTPPAAPPPVRQPMRVTAVPPATAATAAPTTDTQPLPTVTRKTTPAGTTRTRDQYDAMAREYAANATGNYTVQIQILCQESNLAGAIRGGGNNVWFVPQTIAGRACYRVFWGRYATRDAAQGAMASIPAALRDKSAAVKPVPKRSPNG
jgi:septal ring-binding cell division protein DamX